ncbi:MAG TPA: DUF86 domain-containing protein [Firmicutes bacterium]|jgi:uncharacterized protein YutE (UPF0331/DUF86 family)|nr:DUF86 domain-containing protein [Bacillota bacterium]HAN94029.1 DUF86 domain-containing protein [Bacillota bacterium]
MAMIEHEKIRQKVQFMRDRLKQLELVGSMSFQDFASHPFAFDAAVRSLQVLIEAMLDIGGHIVAREGYGIPKTYAGIITLLAEHGVIDREQTANYVAMVRFRNRVVHLYDEVEPAIVYQIIRERLDDFRRFISAIVRRYLSPQD